MEGVQESAEEGCAHRWQGGGLECCCLGRGGGLSSWHNTCSCSLVPGCGSSSPVPNISRSHRRLPLLQPQLWILPLLLLLLLLLLPMPTRHAMLPCPCLLPLPLRRLLLLLPLPLPLLLLVELGGLLVACAWGERAIHLRTAPAAG